MADQFGRLTWFQDRVHQITDVIPNRAFDQSTAMAAGVGARKIGSSYTGGLARDVSRVKRIGPMRSQVGSSRRYARMENFGGTIKPKTAKRLLIRGRRMTSTGSGSRSTYGGEIEASATEVRHQGKHYLEASMAAFHALFWPTVRRMMGRG